MPGKQKIDYSAVAATVCGAFITAGAAVCGVYSLTEVVLREVVCMFISQAQIFMECSPLLKEPALQRSAGAFCIGIAGALVMCIAKKDIYRP